MTSEEDLLQEDIASEPPNRTQLYDPPPRSDVVYVSYGPFPERRRRPRMLGMIAVSRHILLLAIRNHALMC